MLNLKKEKNNASFLLHVLIVNFAHFRHGGIIPTFANILHRQQITTVCENALRVANLRLRDIDAIATTTKPGLPLSLTVGNTFGKYLCRIANKPYIPIHHMEAHAVTIRMVQKVRQRIVQVMCI